MKILHCYNFFLKLQLNYIVCFIKNIVILAVFVSQTCDYEDFKYLLTLIFPLFLSTEKFPYNQYDTQTAVSSVWNWHITNKSIINRQKCNRHLNQTTLSWKSVSQTNHPENLKFLPSESYNQVFYFLWQFCHLKKQIESRN